MLRRNITYESPFTDQKTTEEHFFHISKTDLVEMELEEHDNTYTNSSGEEFTGMRAKLQRIQDSQDGKAIMTEIKDLIRRSYGKKDGERFRKSKEISEDFASSEAFSQLFFELCTDPDAAATFTAGIIPNNLDQIAQEIQERAAKIAEGRAAQETAKAAGASAAESQGSPAIAATERVADETGADFPKEDATDRAKQIAQATSQNPVTLTEAEMRDIDSGDLQSGLASGRYKLS